MTISPPRLSLQRRRLLVTALLVVSFLGALDHTIVSTSLATIAADLGALELLGWIIVGYTLASTVLLPIIGKLGDTVGPRAVFLTSLVCFLAASLACGFAPSMGWLIGARVVQGMSSAGIQLMSQTIIAQVTTPRERPKYMSIVGAAFPIAILVGPLLGGLITDYWGWSWVFWVNLPIGVVACVLATIAVPHVEAPPRAGFDLAGSVTFTVALVALVLGVTWLPDPHAAAQTLTAFGVTAFAGVAFVIIELRAEAPLVPLRLFARRTIGASTALSAVIGIGLFSVTAYLPTYIQMAYRTSATVSGLVPIATVFGMLVSNLSSGLLVSRSGKYWAYPMTGTALGAAGLFGMSVLPVGVPLWAPMCIMFVVGIGTGAFMNLIIAVAQGAVPAEDVGVMTASVNLARQVGATVTTAVVGSVIGLGVAARLPQSLDPATLSPHAVQAAGNAVQSEVAAIYHDVFAPVFLGLAAVYACGVIAAMLLPRERLSNEAPKHSDPSPSANDGASVLPVAHSPERRGEHR